MPCLCKSLYSEARARDMQVGLFAKGVHGWGLALSLHCAMSFSRRGFGLSLSACLFSVCLSSSGYRT